MSEVRVRPSTVEGRLRAPGSKSYTHRFLIAAHFASRSSRLRRPLVSDDTLRTVAALRRLGSRVSVAPGAWTVVPGVGRAGTSATLDCRESGTTLRLVSAAAAVQPRRFRFVGRGRLPVRPMRPLFDALVDLGATVRRSHPEAALPFELRGPIHGGSVALDVGQSSQFTSALLLALPTVLPDSRIRRVGRPVSEPYVRATIEVLRRRRIAVQEDRGGFRIPGGQTYEAGRDEVPGDASSAAYLWAAAAISGGRVTVDGVPPDWPQADLAVLDLLERYGAEVARRGSTVRVEGRARRPFRCELSDAPDLYPLAGVLAAAAPGRSELRGAEHVALKESDRRSETARLARAMGARVRASPAGLSIEGRRDPRPLGVTDLSDHRLVMSAAVGALAATGTSSIGDARAVAKSFPGFFPALRALGAEVVPR
ncbi:MAG TPA: 3-phosphoshikimate 1-carboxyvinyltransferase [Thermoplasmata archaeon]|nr:3-phosphoshikimate 1-carboxyvinyltransferase [Thermoplasmata archaeon]